MRVLTCALVALVASSCCAQFAVAVCPSGGTRQVRVGDASSLKHALTDAQPGDVIELADGQYIGKFTAAVSGTQSAPITICGAGSSAQLMQPDSTGFVMHLKSANYYNLLDFQAKGAQKGVVLDSSSNCTLSGLEVFGTGMEGVHFRANSQYNTLVYSYVHDTGVANPNYGEAVYVGTSKSNALNDNSDYNRIAYNRLGPGVTAELIDIKEYTTGTIVEFNTFDGTGCSGQNSADSWMDVKGNSCVIRSNVGSNALNDGYQTHELVDGWGNNNLFKNNSMAQGAPTAPGMLVNVLKRSTGNVVTCDNSGDRFAGGLSDIACTNQMFEEDDEAATTVKRPIHRLRVALE